MAQATLSLKIWTGDDAGLPDELPEAFEPHAEHVRRMLAQGYVAGDICDDRFRGWWEIEAE